MAVEKQVGLVYSRVHVPVLRQIQIHTKSRNEALGLSPELLSNTEGENVLLCCCAYTLQFIWLPRAHVKPSQEVYKINGLINHAHGIYITLHMLFTPHNYCYILIVYFLLTVVSFLATYKHACHPMLVLHTHNNRASK